jgi:hypothetical protein
MLKFFLQTFTFTFLTNGHLSIHIKTGKLDENGVKDDDWLIL